ncbi:MAG: DNA-directed RNA polymerase subunit alpha [Patescibacteria group bacterium]|jgi:DNA-directed RNA polymerase subunit alpha
MENIPLPSKIEARPGQKQNEEIISIQPCHPGYGTTLGNALRRVMLSSLPGAAVTAFKIKGVSHEFSTVPYVKEDLVEISLNLKQLRLKVYSEEPVRLELKAKGEKVVTAKDIKTNSDVEVINSDLVIATLTNKEAELEIEIVATQGRGYIPTETREKEDLETNMIMIDSIFTPVKNVGFNLESIRVGQMTNYENLILTIETDGSISPQEALNQATQILINHFQFIADQVVPEVKAKKTTKEKKAKEKEEKASESDTEAVASEPEAKVGRKRTKKADKKEDKK